MVSKKLGVDSALKLDGAAACIQAGTSTELAVADYFRENNMKYKVVTFDTSDQTRSGFAHTSLQSVTFIAARAQSVYSVVGSALYSQTQRAALLHGSSLHPASPVFTAQPWRPSRLFSSPASQLVKFEVHPLFHAHSPDRPPCNPIHTVSQSLSSEMAWF